MNTVFETEVEGKKYRHLHYREYTEATVENLMELIEELSDRLDEYNKGDFVRSQLTAALSRDFESDKTLICLSYRISKQL